MTFTSIRYQISQKCSSAVGLFVLIFFMVQSVTAQGWLRHYPSGTDEEPRQLLIAPNGDFIFAGIGYKDSTGHYYLQRNDANGNMIWFKTIEVSGQYFDPYISLVFLTNCPGGGIIAGGNVKLANGLPAELIFKLSDAGDSLWLNIPEPGVWGAMYSAIAAPDGNILTGSTEGLVSSVQMTAVLRKINPTNGSVIWTKSYPHNQFHEQGCALAYTPDGSILQAGVDSWTGIDTTIIRRLDGDGNLLHEILVPMLISEVPVLWRVRNNDFSIILYLAGYVNIKRYDYNGNLLVSTLTSNIYFLPGTGTETPEGYNFTLSPPGAGFLTPALYKTDFDGHFSPPVFPMADFSVNMDYVSKNVKITPDGGLLFVGKNNGQSTWFALKTDSTGHLNPGIMLGNVFRDGDQNCAITNGEPGLQSVQIRATDLSFGSEWYETSDSLGNFALVVPSGDYDIEALAPAGASGFWDPCPPLTAILPLPGDTVLLPDMGLQPLVDCPFLQLDLGAWLFRPCSTTIMTVKVLNAGTMDADSSTVMLEADPALTFVSSTAPLIAQNGNLFWFEAGPVAALQSVQFTVSFAVDCGAYQGQVVCVDGHVSPDSLCAPLDSLWDGAELKVRAICDQDSIHFRVSNIGSGGMDQPSELVIIEDYIILFSIPIQLPAGQDTLISMPNPNGHTYYGRINQTPGFPGGTFSSDGKDFCEPNGTAGMLLQYPLFSGGPFDDRFCDEVRASCDPNDKRGFPLGYGPSNYIERGVPIQYLIRFQNTGNDTAFAITVRDTLPAQLDMTTLRVGSASHPFTWELTGMGVLVFRFANILLPDSTTNETASHGFVQFIIDPKSDITAGTLVQNRAAIYFDYNAAVFTEYAQHTVDSNFIPTRTLMPPQAAKHFTVSPNPALGFTNIALETNSDNYAYPLVLTVSDILGKTLRQELVFDKKHKLLQGDIPAGVCILKLEDQKGNFVAGGKVVWILN